MTGELEQQFFRVFGIEPKWKDKRVKSIKTYYTEEQAQYLRKTTKNRNIQLCYPVITAEKLLEMICILSNYGKYDCWGTTVARLKNAILENCIAVVVLKLLNDITLEQFKHKIQQLFEEEGKNKLYANKDYE